MNIRPLNHSEPISRRWLVFASLICIAAAHSNAASPLVLYPSFRVEIDIFEGETLAPQSQHLILFDSGAAYDMPVGTGPIVTVFDIPRNRVVLLHKISRQRTAITTDRLVQMAAQIRSEAEAKDAEGLGINAKVVLGEKPETYVVKFGASRYEATAQKVTDPAIAAEFASFTAWASRLNVVRHIGSPPFARITLDDFLATQSLIPRQVKLDVRRGLKTRTFRSEHLVVERLSDLDRKKISEVGGMIATFAEVDFESF